MIKCCVANCSNLQVENRVMSSFQCLCLSSGTTFRQHQVLNFLYKPTRLHLCGHELWLLFHCVYFLVYFLWKCQRTLHTSVYGYTFINECICVISLWFTSRYMSCYWLCFESSHHWGALCAKCILMIMVIITIIFISSRAVVTVFLFNMVLSRLDLLCCQWTMNNFFWDAHFPDYICINLLHFLIHINYWMISYLAIQNTILHPEQ